MRLLAAAAATAVIVRKGQRKRKHKKQQQEIFINETMRGKEEYFIKVIQLHYFYVYVYGIDR